MFNGRLLLRVSGGNGSVHSIDLVVVHERVPSMLILHASKVEIRMCDIFAVALGAVNGSGDFRDLALP